MHHSDHTLTALSHLVAGLSYAITGEPAHELGLDLHLLFELRSAVCVSGCAGKRASDERDARADGRTNARARGMQSMAPHRAACVPHGA